MEISKFKIKEFLQSQNGKFVTVYFIKKDGTPRKLNGRISNKDNKVTVDPSRPFICMFDMQIQEFRNVNLSTVYSIKANKQTYKVI